MKSEARIGVRVAAVVSAGALLLSAHQGPAGAAVVASCGQVDPHASLVNVQPGQSENSEQLRVVQESANRLLFGDIMAEAKAVGSYSAPAHLPAPFAIPAGIKVDSYLVHSDPVGGAVGAGKRFVATLTFTSDILGVIVGDDRLAASDAAVGSAAVSYPGTTGDRGIELSEALPKVDFFEIVDARTIELSLLTTTVVDQVRIITAATPKDQDGGYRMVASDGGVFNFGGFRDFGSAGAVKLNQPIVGGAATCSGNGYWLVASDGGVFRYGDASFHGSTGNVKLNQPIVGMAATPSGKGYWLVASDGGVFRFGDAVFHGSTGDVKLNQPIVGMAATPSGKGYWLVASDGGVFRFGDAVFHGSTGDVKLNQPIVGMAATPSGDGYWLVASDGGVFRFGDAAFHGSTGDVKLNQPIVGMKASDTGKGYVLVASDGGVFRFGDAAFVGSAGGSKLNQPVKAIF